MTTTATNRHTAQNSPFAATLPGERPEAYAQLAAQARCTTSRCPMESPPGQ
jgi:hypothetical protein